MSLYSGFGISEPKEIVIPAGISLLIGKKNHYFEPGLGMTFFIYGKIAQVFRFGYRYQNRKKGLIFRIAFTPFTYLDDGFMFSNEFNFNGGISFGYAF